MLPHYFQFKKGSFEVGGTIYPVAIKYDPKFGDAFWNSSKYGMMAYIYMMMTSWAIVCDVWYLPPMKRRDDEDAVVFANRVKAEIARQGGLVDLMWSVHFLFLSKFCFIKWGSEYWTSSVFKRWN